MLLPTSGLIQHGIVTQGCDRYAYFPSAIFVPLLGHVVGQALVGSEAPRGRRFTQQRQRSSPSSTFASVSYGATLIAFVLLSNAQMETWRNERALYEHSLRSCTTWTLPNSRTICPNPTLHARCLLSSRLDPTDWRMYSWLAKTLASATPPVCVDEPETCQQLWRLARTFAPTRSLTGVLFRTKVLVPLGEFDLACSTYEQLLLAHPESPPVLNNVGVCRLLRGVVALSEARELFTRAAHAPDTAMYAQGSVAHTLAKFEAWAAAFREVHGDREPTEQERLTFNDWVMV